MTLLKLIHRHIGGLEKVVTERIAAVSIHRHIGGLEKRCSKKAGIVLIHRHIGGLEKIPNE